LYNTTKTIDIYPFMKTYRHITFAAAFLGFGTLLYGQSSVTADQSLPSPAKNLETAIPGANAKPVKQKVVVVTGARFSYPLVQKWIDDYNRVKPDVQIIIESRGTTDPDQYDILAEVYQQDDAIKENRDYLNVARYAILPVANSKSSFGKTYSEKGLTKELINQVYFHDLYTDKEDLKKIKAPYTVYTRLQKAGVPIVFTKYFGFEQKDIKGKAIAGADEHLLKALLRDSTGISYLPLALIYDHASKKPLQGITVLPVDLNGNGRVNDDEKFYADQTQVIERLEQEDLKDLHNIPIEYLHLSIDKHNTNPEVIDFLNWVIDNGQTDLGEFGYLKPEANRFEQEKFTFASKRQEK
jgi:phosphate transport system substrate-binding protein